MLQINERVLCNPIAIAGMLARGVKIRERSVDVLCRMAPRAGFEPATYPLGGDRAIQLCHRGMGLILPLISAIGERVTTINKSMIDMLRKARKLVCKESVQ